MAFNQFNQYFLLYLLIPTVAAAGVATPEASAKPSCSPDQCRINLISRTDQPDIYRTVKQYEWRLRWSLGRLRKKIEEWGVVTASEPVVMEVRGQFAMGADNTFPGVGTYIENERLGVSGLSAVSNETGFSNQAGASFQGTFQSNPITGQIEPVLASGTTLQTGTSSFSSPLPPINVSNTLLSGSTAPPGGLLAGLGAITGIPERAAILLGVNDKLTEKILTTMANPPWDNFSNNDYEVVFAIIQVSCNPGWRTRYNYIADISASCDYYSSKAHMLRPDCEAVHPLVFSVLPLLDAQNLSLASSNRSITALAAQVNAAYPTVGLSILGQDLITFVHRYQKDSSTRTAMTVTNSYSTGRTFGFRFAPSFVGQKNPGLRSSQAGLVLQATTIPVLVTVVVNRNDFLDADNVALSGTHKCVTYDEVVTHFTNRWLINDRPPLYAWYRRLWTPLQRERFGLRIDWAEDVQNIKSLYAELLRDTACSDDAPSDSIPDRYEFDPVISEIREEVDEFTAKTNAEVTFFRISPDPERQKISIDPDFLAISPTSVPATDPFQMVIRGKNLRNVREVTIGGKLCSADPSVLYQDKQGNSAILVTFPQGPMVETRTVTVSPSANQPVLLTDGSNARLADNLTKLQVISGTSFPSVSATLPESDVVDTGTASALGSGTTPIGVIIPPGPATGVKGTQLGTQLVTGTAIVLNTAIQARLVVIGSYNHADDRWVDIAPVDSPPASPKLDASLLSIDIKRDPNGNVTSLSFDPSKFASGKGAAPAAKADIRFNSYANGFKFSSGTTGITISSGMPERSEPLGIITAACVNGDVQGNGPNGTGVTSAAGFTITSSTGIAITVGQSRIFITGTSGTSVVLTGGMDPAASAVFANAGNGVSIGMATGTTTLSGTNADITFTGTSSELILSSNIPTQSFTVQSIPSPPGASGTSAAPGGDQIQTELLRDVTEMITDPHRTVVVPSGTPAPAVSVKAQ